MGTEAWIAVLFDGEAKMIGYSTSRAWLRAAGRERLAKASERPGMQTTEALDAFFQQCDEREKAGREPDWEEHLKVIASSRASAASDS